MHLSSFCKLTSCPCAEEEKADVWMMGDFNFEDGEEDRGLPPQVRERHFVFLVLVGWLVACTPYLAPKQWVQFTDVWPSLYPTQPGYTYDPQINAMAAETTSSGRSRYVPQPPRESNQFILRT
jgi:hypothetical protein